MDWSGCTEVEEIPGKVSGVPILRLSRVPAEAILGNYNDDTGGEFNLQPSMPANPRFENVIFLVLASCSHCAALQLHAE